MGDTFNAPNCGLCLWRCLNYSPRTLKSTFIIAPSNHAPPEMASPFGRQNGKLDDMSKIWKTGDLKASFSTGRLCTLATLTDGEFRDSDQFHCPVKWIDCVLNLPSSNNFKKKYYIASFSFFTQCKMWVFFNPTLPPPHHKIERKYQK